MMSQVLSEIDLASSAEEGITFLDRANKFVFFFYSLWLSDSIYAMLNLQKSHLLMS